MRKLLTAGLAALTFAGAALPAAAADHRYYRRHHDNGSDEAIVAGIAGLAIGAALASGGGRRDRYYDGYRYDRGGYGYYNRGYYPRGRAYGYYGHPRYAYDRGHRRCRTTTAWDPWADAYIRRTRCW